MTDTPNTTPTAPETVDMTWDELRDIVQTATEGVYLATADGDGQPHVAFVQPGWADDGRLWFTSFASSRKIRNLRSRPEVAITCAPSPTFNLLLRAEARLVEDLAETRRLWDGGVVPYDPSMFFQGPEDPETQFVELRPTVATIHPLGPGPVHRYRPT